MHKEILSDKERITLKKFLESGKMDDRLLKFNIRKNCSVLTQDFNLVKKAYEKFSES
jgi:uncharacterized protein YacL